MEPGAPLQLRASVRHTSAVGRGVWHAISFSDTSALAEFVREWSDDVRAQTVSPRAPRTRAEDRWVNEGGANVG